MRSAKRDHREHLGDMQSCHREQSACQPHLEIDRENASLVVLIGNVVYVKWPVDWGKPNTTTSIWYIYALPINLFTPYRFLYGRFRITCFRILKRIDRYCEQTSNESHHSEVSSREQHVCVCLLGARVGLAMSIFGQRGHCGHR